MCKLFICTWRSATSWNISSPAHCKITAISFSTSSSTRRRSLAISRRVITTVCGPVSPSHCTIQGNFVRRKSEYAFTNLKHEGPAPETGSQQRAPLKRRQASHSGDVCLAERQNGYIGLAAWAICYATDGGFGVNSQRTTSRVFTCFVSQL